LYCTIKDFVFMWHFGKNSDATSLLKNIKLIEQLYFKIKEKDKSKNKQN